MCQRNARHGRTHGRCRYLGDRGSAAVVWAMAVVPALASAVAMAPHGHRRDPPASGLDVVVFGATPGGIAAAVAAARTAGGMGKSAGSGSARSRVWMLEPSRWVGGMMAGGLGCTDKVGESAVGGIALEFVNRTAAAYPPGRVLPHCTRSFEPHVASDVFDAMLSEAGVGVTLNASLVAVRMLGGRITSVDVAAQDGAGQPVRVSAAVFVDASYEGDLVAMAGVNHTIGRESQAQYGEDGAGRGELGRCGYGLKAPIDPYGDDGAPLPLIYGGSLPPVGAADAKVQSYNYRLCWTNATDPTKRVEMSKPDGYDPAFWEAPRRYMKAHPPASLSTEVLKIYDVASSGDGVKTDVNAADYPFSTDFAGGSWAYPNGTREERDAIVKRHVAYTKGLLWFLRTDASVPAGVRDEMTKWAWCADEFVDNDHFPWQLYVREASRMVGAVVATEHHMRAGALPDPNASVGLADYATDVHSVEIAVDASGGARPRAAVEGCISLTPRVGAWEVPYGALTPRLGEAANLLVPVALSASHVAFSTIRLELTWMVLGQSAGVAAAVAAASGVAVQSLPLPELHAELLRQGQRLHAPRRPK